MNCWKLVTIWVRVYRRPGHQTGGLGGEKSLGESFSRDLNFFRRIRTAKRRACKIDKKKREMPAKRSLQVMSRHITQESEMQNICFSKTCFVFLSTKDCQCVS